MLHRRMAIKKEFNEGMASSLVVLEQSVHGYDTTEWQSHSFLLSYWLDIIIAGPVTAQQVAAPTLKKLQQG